jgi:spermidine synthase
LLYVLFFASGATALVYETAWVRVLSFELGSTVDAVTTVLAVFMAGLAIGGYLFGRLIDRGRNPLAVYAALEIVLAAFAVAFVLMRPHLHRAVLAVMPASGPAAASWFVTLLLAAAVMLPPTILMGGTLPVLAKQVVRSSDTLGARLGALYGWNTLGAVLGCLAQTLVLTVSVGVRGSILLAACVNVVLGIIAAAIAALQRREAAVVARQAAATPAGPYSLPPPAILPVIAFSSGFVTLAAEVLWTRLFINFLSANVLVFATILAAFLAGLGLGSLAIAHRLDRLRRLDAVVSLTLIASGLWLLLTAVGQTGLARWFDAIQRWETANWPAAAPFITLAVLFVVSLPASATVGLTFPLVLRWGNSSWADLGTGIGRLYAANTLGSILGSVLAGFVLLRFLGVTASLLALAGVLGLVAFLAGRGLTLRVAALALAGMGGVLALDRHVAKPAYWFNGGFSGVREIPVQETLFFAEGAEATVGVFERNGVRSLTVNGLIVADTSRQDLWDLLLKAHLPMLLHPQPRRVALVGLGAGVSLGAVQAHDVDHIDCIEISREVVAAHRLFGHVNGRCWEDARTRVTIDDGRRFLTLSKERYDVISVDPVDPPVCNLYTRDFFQVCHDRLTPGGLMVQWLPLFRLSREHLRVVMQAFASVFRESTAWYDGTSLLLVGCRDQPLRIDVPTYLRRTAQPRVVDNLALIGNPGPWLILSTYVTGPQGLARLIGSGAPENTDDRPFLEYDVLRAGPLDGQDLADNLEMLTTVFEPVDPLLVNRHSPDGPDELRHAAKVMPALLEVRIHSLRQQEAVAAELLDRAVTDFGLQAPDLRLLEPFLEH